MPTLIMKCYHSQSRYILILTLFVSLSAIVISACSSSTPNSTQAPASSPQVTTTPSPLPTPSLAAMTASPYPRRSFPPLQDQVTPGSSFVQFRQQLQQAIQQRNAKFMRDIADPQIKITFGPPMEFSALGFDDPNSLAWKRLERIVAIGCSPYEAPAGTAIDAYQCPHVSQSAVGDPFSDVHILGEAVNVRSQPRSDSPVIDTLNNEIVKFDSTGFEQFTQEQRDLAQTLEGWMPVVTPGGKRGYVSSRYAAIAAGYRARFENKQGQWKMTIFITGD